MTIAAVSGLAFGATSAFFSDTETSEGNVLAAGAIDLQIDNDSYYGWDETGTLLLPSPDTSWDLADLDDGDGPADDGSYLFFNFLDIKPGDVGEDTISLNVTDNDAWVCVDIEITANDDFSSTEPELEDGDAEESGDDFDGELAQHLDFIFWVDDGDNVLENDEEILTEGLASNILNNVTWPIADSTTGNGPLTGTETFHIGKAWCFGDIYPEPLDQEDAGGPDVRGPGVTCDGAAEANNITQTDRLEGNVSFRAVQERNNPDFECLPPDQEG